MTMKEEIKVDDSRMYSEQEISNAVRHVLMFQMAAMEGKVKWDRPIGDISPFEQKVIARLRGLE